MPIDPFPLGEYHLTRLLFQRGLGIIYLVAFLVAARQFRPLVGESGLLPIDRYVQGTAFVDRPSLFYQFPSDRAITIAAWSGVALSMLAVLGGPHWLPEPYPIPAAMLLWGTLWLLYLSFVNAGQLFYGYGWESMLLETGFLAVFLGAGATAPPVLVIWLLKWVLFRNMFGAGLIKIRGDDCWRELTCLERHYETQPMPNPLSWYAHHLPRPFHRLEVLGNHVVELAIPFLYFGPQPYAAVAGGLTIAFQAWLMLTGNFSFLNALTIVQGTVTFSDGTLAQLPAVTAPHPAATPLPLTGLAALLGLLIVALSVQPVRNILSPAQRMNYSFDPLHLVNTYGAFGSITRHRYQLVIEGTTADHPGPEDWEAYEFNGQPVRLDERPPQWAPYHLRLDWQLWFAAMRPRPAGRQAWVLALLDRLLAGDSAALGLLGADPFPGTTPTAVRVTRYRYAFTDPDERAATGDWWTRERVNTYVQPVTSADLQRIRTGTPHGFG